LLGLAHCDGLYVKCELMMNLFFSESFNIALCD
jgi:hypothetical protein